MIKLPKSAESSKNKRVPEKYLFCFIDYAKDFDCAENSKEDGNTRPPDLPLKKPVCRSGSNGSNGHGTTDWFQIGKGVHQGCYCHPAYLTSMQSTS